MLVVRLGSSYKIEIRYTSPTSTDDLVSAVRTRTQAQFLLYLIHLVTHARFEPAHPHVYQFDVASKSSSTPGLGLADMHYPCKDGEKFPHLRSAAEGKAPRASVTTAIGWCPIHAASVQRREMD
jgi:hypothetical protein